MWDPDIAEFLQYLTGNTIFTHNLLAFYGFKHSRNLSIDSVLAGFFFDILSDSGILVVQLGRDYSFLSVTPLLVDILAKVGFQSIVFYQGSGGRFGGPWGFAVVMKDWDTRSNWFRSSAEVDLQIHRRTLRTTKSAFPFHFFDGASMMKYQAPSRKLESAWCQIYPQNCLDGHGYNPELENIPASAFEVKPSVIAKGGRGVFAKQFISKGSVVAMDDCVHAMHIPSTTFELMQDMEERFESASKFWSAVFDAYLDGYGWTGNQYVSFIFLDLPLMSQQLTCLSIVTIFREGQD